MSSMSETNTKRTNFPSYQKKRNIYIYREREKESMKLSVTQRVFESMCYLGIQGGKRHGLSPLGELLEPKVKDRLITIIEKQPRPPFTYLTNIACSFWR